jgi:hypothetical protein
MPQDDERKDLSDQQGVEERSLTIWAVYESQYQTDSKPKVSPTHNSHDGAASVPMSRAASQASVMKIVCTI